MATKKNTQKNHDTNVFQLLTISFVVLLIVGNLVGLYFTYSTFNQIVNPNTQNASTNTSQLIEPLNTNLYTQIQTSRQNRFLYNDSFTSPHYSYNEVFGLASTTGQ